MILLKVRRVVSATSGELPIKSGGGSFKPSGYKRETQEGEVPENTGYTESSTAAELKVKLNASVDPSEFIGVSNDTLTIYLDGGGEHVMPNAWVTETPELSSGEYEVTYNSGKSERMK